MKIKIIAIALLICAAFCSCSQQESSKQEYYQIVTDPVTEPVQTEPNGAEKYVEAAREESFVTEENSKTTETTTFRLPKITTGAKDAEAINSEILKTYEKDFEEAQKSTEEGKTPEVIDLSYESYLNDIVLSIVITRT